MDRMPVFESERRTLQYAECPRVIVEGILPIYQSRSHPRHRKGDQPVPSPDAVRRRGAAAQRIVPVRDRDDREPLVKTAGSAQRLRMTRHVGGYMTKNNFDIQNKGDNMSRQLTKLTSIYFALLILVLVGGCSGDDCPTCPKDEVVQPYKGWLYYSEHNPSLYDIYKVDMETDSIVDSLMLPLEESAIFDVSADGRLLAVRDATFDFYSAKTWLYDAQTFDLLGEIPYAVSPYFDLEHGRIVGMRADSLDTYITVLSYPSMTLLQEDTLGGFLGQYLDAKRGFIYGWGGSSLRFRFYRFDYINRELELIPITHWAGDTVQVIDFCLNQSGNRVYIRGLSVPGPFQGFTFTGTYDLQSETLLWSYKTMGQYGGLALSPDEREVYMTDPGISGYSGLNPGAFFVLDSGSGALLEAVSTFGYRDNPLSPLSTSDVIFSPTGEKAYLATGAVGDRQPASVLVIDTETRNITKILSPDLQRHPRNLRIGPKI